MYNFKIQLLQQNYKNYENYLTITQKIIIHNIFKIIFNKIIYKFNGLFGRQRKKTSSSEA